jgi:hypothetical protein
MRATAVLAALLALGSVAHADDDDDSDSDSDGDDDDGDGLFGDPELWFHLGVQLGPGAGTPVSIAPDVRYLRHSLEIGLLHSSEAITGFTGIYPGPSVCVHGATCDAYSSPYHGGALQIAYGTIKGLNLLKLEAGLVVNDFDPFEGGIKLGGELWRLVGDDGVMVTAKPNILVAQHDASRLNLPVSIGFFFFFQVESGISMPLSNSSDGWQVPLTFKLAYPLGTKLLGDLALTFPALAGGDAVEGKGADDAAVTIGLDFSPLINGW